MEVEIPPRKGAILGVFYPIEKHRGLVLWHFKQQNNQYGDSGTAAAGSNAPEWTTSEYVVAREKICHLMWPIVNIL